MDLTKFTSEVVSQLNEEKEKSIKEELLKIPDLIRVINIFYSICETPLEITNDSLNLSANCKIGIRRNTDEEIMSNFVKYFKHTPS